MNLPQFSFFIRRETFIVEFVELVPKIEKNTLSKAQETSRIKMGKPKSVLTSLNLWLFLKKRYWECRVYTCNILVTIQLKEVRNLRIAFVVMMNKSLKILKISQKQIDQNPVQQTPQTEKYVAGDYGKEMKTKVNKDLRKAEY